MKDNEKQPVFIDIGKQGFDELTKFTNRVTKQALSQKDKNADKDLMQLCKLLFENWDGTVINAAKTVLEYYQPKLPENSIVLSKEEYEILTKDIEHPTDKVLKKLLVGKNILTEQAIEKTTKEAAKKCIEIIKRYVPPKSGLELEIAREFGVNIKE